jgi:hypothetical protein
MLNTHFGAVHSNLSDEKFLKFFESDDFEMSVPEYPTRYSTAGNQMCWILWSIIM